MNFMRTRLGRKVLADDWIAFHTDTILDVLWAHVTNPFNSDDAPLALASLGNVVGLDFNKIEEICYAQRDRGWVEVVGPVNALAARLTPLGRDEVSFRSSIAHAISSL
jgi:hypothetical protein